MGLWEDAIRLAHRRPEMREHVLPLLVKVAGASLYSTLLNKAKRETETRGWETYLVFSRSMDRLDKDSANRLKTILRKRLIGVASKPKDRKRGWYARYHGHRPRKDLFLSSREADTRAEVVGGTFPSLDYAVKALREYHRSGKWEPDVTSAGGILSVLDAGMKFASGKRKDISVRASIMDITERGELKFESRGTGKTDIRSMRNLMNQTKKFLQKKFPDRKVGTSKIQFYYVGRMAEGTHGKVLVSLNPDEYSMRGPLSKEIKALNEKHLAPLRAEREKEKKRRQEELEREREAEREAEKEQEAQWVRSLSSEDRQLYNNLTLLKQEAKKRNNSWLLNFSTSVLDQFKSRGRLSAKQMAVVNRNLDQLGIERNVSREEAKKRKKQRKLNQPFIDRIKALPNYQDKDLMVSFLRQLESGHSLSPKQIAVLEKWAPPLVGSKASLKKDFQSLSSQLKKAVVPALADAWKELYASEGMKKDAKSAPKELRAAFRDWAGGEDYAWSWANAQLSQTPLGALLDISAPDSDWLFQLRDQVERASQAKSPTKKAKRYIATMRDLLGALQGKSRKDLKGLFLGHIR